MLSGEGLSKIGSREGLGVGLGGRGLGRLLRTRSIQGEMLGRLSRCRMACKIYRGLLHLSGARRKGREGSRVDEVGLAEVIEEDLEEGEAGSEAAVTVGHREGTALVEAALVEAALVEVGETGADSAEETGVDSAEEIEEEIEEETEDLVVGTVVVTAMAGTKGSPDPRLAEEALDKMNVTAEIEVETVEEIVVTVVNVANEWTAVNVVTVVTVAIGIESEIQNVVAAMIGVGVDPLLVTAETVTAERENLETVNGASLYLSLSCVFDY